MTREEHVDAMYKALQGKPENTVMLVIRCVDEVDVEQRKKVIEWTTAELSKTRWVGLPVVVIDPRIDISLCVVPEGWEPKPIEEPKSKCESCGHDAITRERIEGGICEVCDSCGMSWNLDDAGNLWTEEPKGVLSDEHH